MNANLHPLTEQSEWTKGYAAGFEAAIAAAKAARAVTTTRAHEPSKAERIAYIDAIYARVPG